MNLPEDLNLRIDPAKVSLYVGTKYPRPIAPKRHLPIAERWLELLVYIRYSRLLNPNWDRRAQPIDQLDKYLKVKDLAEKNDRFRDSLWYQSLLADLRNQGLARHKKIKMRDEAELDRFFTTYACELVRSMREQGYLADRGARPVGVAVGRDGALLKTNAGDHRFFAARCLGVKPVPVRVKFIHPRWLKANGLTLLTPDADRLRAALRSVEQAGQ